MLQALNLVLMLLLASTASAVTTKIVHVGQGGLKFVDEESQTSTTTVDPGDTVEWVWEGNFPHSTTRDTAPETWDSGVLRGAGTMFPHTFSIDGSYDYFCTPHRTLGMTGTVVVRAPTTPDAKLVVSGGRLTALQVAIDAAASKGQKSFDKVVNKAAKDTQDARTLLASGKKSQAKASLRHAIRGLITLRQRLGSNTGRSRIKDDAVRTNLITEAQKVKADLQALLKST